MFSLMRAFLLAASLCSLPIIVMAAPAQGLRDIPAPHGFRIGSAVSSYAFDGDAKEAQTVKREYSIVVSESDMKFNALHPNPDPELKGFFSASNPCDTSYLKAIDDHLPAYDFSKADKLVAFAQANHLTVRGHNLVWHQSFPAWFVKRNATCQMLDIHGLAINESSQVIDDKNAPIQLNGSPQMGGPPASRFDNKTLVWILQHHITTVISHYLDRFPGVVTEWDVVNEAFGFSATAATDPTYLAWLRDSVWSSMGKSKDDYIALAYWLAYKADPTIKLYYNETGDMWSERGQARLEQIIAMIAKLQKQKVPIQGVGFQMHMDADSKADYRLIYDNFARFRKMGLEVAITELDVAVDLKPWLPATLPTEEMQFQAAMNKAEKQVEIDRPDIIAQEVAIYRNLTRVCLRSSNCKAMLTWGVNDTHSWLNKYSHSGLGLMFDRQYEKKAEYEAVRKEMEAGGTPDRTNEIPLESQMH